MPTIKRFFANITSHRDNGAEIELNLRGVFTYERGTMENSFESYSETRVTQCNVITRMASGGIKSLKIDFYEFSEEAQARFLEKAEQDMEVEN